MDFKIAIPTFRRYDIFFNKTYPLLKKHNLLDKIILFLQDDDDEKTYAKLNLKIVRVNKGFRNAVNDITNYFNLGEKYIQIHDDISDILTIENEKLVSVINADILFTNVFNKMIEENAGLGGFYPVANAYFMRNLEPITTNIRFIYDPITFFINRKILITTSLNNKEDYERTIRHFINDGKIIRFNKVSFKTKFNPLKNKTGVGIRNLEHIKKDDEKLIAEFGKYIKYTKRHKSGTTSFILK